jgi:hypothetical protein
MTDTGPVKVNVRGNVLSLYFDEIAQGWEQWVLLSADRHHDNVYCNRDLERKHLEQAKQRQAGILDFGDLFCAMQGKYDPRSNMDDIRPEDVGQDYLDRIVTHAAEDYGSYARHWWMLGRGNHETNIRKRHGMDLTSNLVHRLNADYGAACSVGGFGGWVRFLFTIHGTKRQSYALKYHHGAGGGGPVTRGVIQTNRQAVYLPDADIVVNGHTHDSWYVPIARERLSNRGVIYQDLIRFIRVPGYKNEYNDGSKGYHIEKWGPPKPQGAAWLRFYCEAHESRIEVEVTQAIQ